MKKTALITGSTSGIGQAIARRFLKEGHSVIIHGRSSKSVNKAITEIKAYGLVSGVFGDLAQSDAVESINKQLKSLEVTVDILVNNAAVFQNHDWDSASMEDWARLYQINVVSHVGLIKLASQHMRAKGWGRIINISSGESTKPFAHMPDYAASKAAMNNMTVSLSKHLAHTGITVNSISPGIIRSESVENWYLAEAERFGWEKNWEAVESGIIRDVLPNNSGYIGRPEEVANFVAFLTSADSGYINGANLRIDGGSTDHVN